jgi:GNAT superfamily N-acetyltransferase
MRVQQAASAEPPQVHVVSTPAAWAAYAAVLADQRRWLEHAVGSTIEVLQPGAAAEYDDPAGHYASSGGVALLACLGARPAGIVALAPVAGLVRAVELKRMYVRPVARGSGVGRCLASKALDLARAGGWERVVLDTHLARMAEAVDLYRSLGFVRVPALGLARAEGVGSFALDLRDRARKPVVA